MADEKKPTVPEEIEEIEEGGEKKSKMKMIIILALVVIVGGGAGGYFFFGNKLIQKLSGKQVEETGNSAEEAKKAEAKKKELVGPILSLDPFVFNMSGNQSKYAKVTIGLELKDARIMEETKKMTPVIRDKVLSILGAKAAETFMDINQRNTLKTEIHTALKPLFKEGEELRGVYITDIIIQ